MITRLRLALEQDEYTALLQLAADELRNPTEQLRKILRDELKAHKLLPPDAGTSSKVLKTKESAQGNHG